MNKKTDMFLPTYAGLMVFLLIVVMLLVDHHTPKLFIFILIAAYIAFIWFYLWRHRQSGERIVAPTLKEFQ